MDIEKTNIEGTRGQDLPDESCAELIDEAVSGEPGIVGVEVDTRRGRVAVDYDSHQVSDADAGAVAARLAPSLQHRLGTCTLRLRRQGGRACESCALNLERRLERVPGVREAQASYRGGILRVTYDDAVTSPEQITRKVKEFGHPLGATLEAAAHAAPELSLSARIRAWLSGGSLELVFTVITFAAMVLGLVAERMEAAPGVPIVLYTLAYLAGGTFGVKASIESLRHRTVDIDLLMILAALGAAAIGAPFEGALLLFLFSLSNVLQDYAIGRTRGAIQALMKLRPEEALILRGRETVPVPIEEVQVGEVVLVRPGDRVPLDGVVRSGESALDQSSLTGESVPVDKEPGDEVFAGTINGQGALEVRVTKRAQESTLARLIEMVEEAQSEKAGTQRFIDRAEQAYALGVIAFTLLAIAVPTVLLGEAFGSAFYRAMTLMVAASPCALVISTPATVLSAIGNGARRGVLFKGGIHVEQAATVKVVAFDKTGTLTHGKPRLTDVRLLSPAADGWNGTEEELLRLAAAVQAKSEHALARATVEAAEERGLAVPEAAAFQAATGKGVQAEVEGQSLHIGNLRYFEGFDLPAREAAEREVHRLQQEGKTCVLVARLAPDGRTAHPLGLLAFADVLRAGVAGVIRDLRSLGVERVVMLTGDNAAVAQAVAEQAGVDAFYPELLPEDKVRLVKALQDEYGAVAMVGDGVNDAPALATATLGIAMGAAGTDVALETADVVLMADDLEKIPYAFALSRHTRRTLVANLVFAVGIIVAMVASILTVGLPLPLAVVGHEGSTVIVSLNGIRLLAFRHRPHST